MSDPNGLFRQAMADCDAGAFGEAAAAFRLLLQMIPGHPQILAGLANAELGLGHGREAVALFQQALAVPAPQPHVWCDLARALRREHRLGEALVAVERSLSLAPDLVEAWTCRGNVLWDLDRLDEALGAYRRAASLRPDEPRIQFNLANTLRKLKRTAEAIEVYRRCVAQAPDYAEAQQNLAAAYYDLGRYDEALAAIARATALKPGDASARDTCGQILHALGRFDEAVEELGRAVALAPDNAVERSNRGVSLHAAGRLAEALADFDAAIACDPSYADAIVNRGTLLKDMGRLEEAAAAYEDALKVAPAHSEALWNQSLMALLHGDYDAGWRGYEARWQSKVQAGHYLVTPKPQWRGEDLTGKTILLWWEQGYGDYIQFSRYVPLVAARGARVLLETPPRLASLMARMPGAISVMEAGAREAAFDVHCPLMSLPLAFGTTCQTVPAAIPYLSAAPEKIAAFEAQLGARPRIALVWAANVNNIHARARSMAPDFLEPLLALPYAFHVVQKDFRPEDEVWLEKFPRLPVHAGAQNDFHDAAALLAAMDLIVTVDTAVAHLAGALGKPVFVLLPHIPDWRWMMGRQDTPWYPTMRLFRQPAPGDWAGAVAAVCAALREGLPPEQSSLQGANSPDCRS